MFFCEFHIIFSKTLFTKHLSWWLPLLIPPFQPRFYPMVNFFHFFPSFFSFHYVYKKWRMYKCITMKIFFTFYNILFKNYQECCESNLALVITCQHTLEKIPISLCKSLGNCLVSRRILKAVYWRKTEWHWFSFCIAEMDKSLVKDENWISRGSSKVLVGSYVD